MTRERKDFGGGAITGSSFATGMLSGFGLFETMRAYRGSIAALDAHIARLYASARRAGLKMSCAAPVMKRRVMRAVERSGLPDARVRLTVFDRGTNNIVITAERYKAPSPHRYRQGFSAGISTMRVDESSPLAGMKSVSRMLYEMARREAAACGCDEAVLLNRGGYLSEGSRSSLFFVAGGEVLTPALSCGCLPGITRALVIARCRREKRIVREGMFVLGDLARAREAFLTNALMGVMPLTRVGGRPIGTGVPGPVTSAMMRFYQELIRREDR